MWFCKIFNLFMAPARLSILKFVGTISLGLLTGMSYSLSTLAIPSILSLPSSSAAAKALASLTTLTQQNLHRLARLSTSVFLLAFVTSPAAIRHPYLLYTSVFAGAAGAASFISPALLGETAVPIREKVISARPLEASYDDIGSTTMVDDFVEDEVNGEEVRALAENYVKTRIVETGFSSIAFVLAVLGIWGDATTVV